MTRPPHSDYRAYIGSNWWGLAVTSKLDLSTYRLMEDALTQIADDLLLTEVASVGIDTMINDRAYDQRGKIPRFTLFVGMHSFTVTDEEMQFFTDMTTLSVKNRLVPVGIDEWRILRPASVGLRTIAFKI